MLAGCRIMRNVWTGSSASINISLRPVSCRSKPSEYIFENIYLTFQDDEVAFRYADSMNWRRLMWANDFPHPDASWPNSQALIEKQAAMLTPEQRRAILCGNAAALYGFDLERLTALAA